MGTSLLNAFLKKRSLVWPKMYWVMWNPGVSAMQSIAKIAVTFSESHP